MTPRVRSFAELKKNLADSQAKSAGHVAPVPAAPEKDPNDKGTTTVPKDPNAAPEKAHIPESKTNADDTPTLTPPSAKKVETPEKVASTLLNKATNLVNSLKDLRGKSAAQVKAATEVKKPQVMGQGAPPNPHDNKGGTQAPAPMSSGPKGDAVAKTAEADGVKDKTLEGKVEMPKQDSKGELPKEVTNTNKTATAADQASKLATDESLAKEMAEDPMFYAKIAAVILQFEDGRAMAQQCLERHHGLETAEDIIKAAMYMEKLTEQLNSAEAQGVREAEEFWKQASDADRTMMIKLSNTHAFVRSKLKTELEKQAYDEGAKMAAQMSDPMGGQEGAPNMLQAPPEGQPDPGMPGEQISDEDIMAVLDQLVQSGELQPEVAAQIVQALTGGGAGGGEGAPGGVPGDAPAGPQGPAGGLPPGGPEGAAGGGMPPGMGGGGMPPGMGGGGGGEPEPEMPPEAKKEAAEIMKMASAAVDLFDKAA